MTKLIPYGALEVSEFDHGGCHHIGNSGINELSDRYWQNSCGPDGWYDSFAEAEAALFADNERRQASGQ